MIVRKLRLQRGWTQDELSEISGLSIRTLQRLERGATPRLETARILAAVFEVDIQTFQPPPPETPDMAHTDPHPDTQAQTATLKDDEQQALAYAKRLMDLGQSALAYIIIAVTFLVFMGPEPILLVILGAIGAGLLIQTVFALEILRLPTVNLERALAERKLGRKL